MFLLIPIAFISGILTSFSPCVLPILPAVLASGIDGNTRRIKGVILGLVISFTIASLLLATIVRVLGIPADTVRALAVVLLVIFGISLVFPVIWEKVQIWIERHWHFQPVQNQNSGFWGGFLTGTSLGIVWTPCIGPVVAAMATLAAVSSFSLSMIAVVLAYAIGAGIPLYFIARGGSAASQKLAFLKTENQKIRQVFGIIILATALFIWTGLDRVLQGWTLANLPQSWTQIATTFESSVKVDTQLRELKGGGQQVQKVSLQNDFTGAKVKPEDLLQGCFGQDCIPSIDSPKFESANDAGWLRDEDMVFAINYKGIIRAYQIKTVVYGIEIGGKSKAYPENKLREKRIIEDSIGDIPIRLEQKESGEIKAVNLQTNEEIIPIRLFWFAWAAFHPDTELFK